MARPSIANSDPMAFWSRVKEDMRMIQGLAEEQRSSGAIVHGGLVRLAGRAADDANLDTGGQTAGILRQVDALSQQDGTHKRRPLSLTAVLADIRLAPA